jgi:hypothetical protein
MLNFDCAMCGDGLTQPGAILLGPPRLDSTVTKTHLCGTCFNAMLALIERQEPRRRELRDRAPNR